MITKLINYYQVNKIKEIIKKKILTYIKEKKTFYKKKSTNYSIKIKDYIFLLNYIKNSLKNNMNHY